MMGRSWMTKIFSKFLKIALFAHAYYFAHVHGKHTHSQTQTCLHVYIHVCMSAFVGQSNPSNIESSTISNARYSSSECLPTGNNNKMNQTHYDTLNIECI